MDHCTDAPEGVEARARLQAKIDHLWATGTEVERDLLDLVVDAAGEGWLPPVEQWPDRDDESLLRWLRSQRPA